MNERRTGRHRKPTSAYGHGDTFTHAHAPIASLEASADNRRVATELSHRHDAPRRPMKHEEFAG
jgi:hypothetical protein